MLSLLNCETNNFFAPNISSVLATLVVLLQPFPRNIRQFALDL